MTFCCWAVGGEDPLIRCLFGWLSRHNFHYIYAGAQSNAMIYLKKKETVMCNRLQRAAASNHLDGTVLQRPNMAGLLTAVSIAMQCTLPVLTVSSFLLI